MTNRTQSKSENGSSEDLRPVLNAEEKLLLRTVGRAIDAKMTPALEQLRNEVREQIVELMAPPPVHNIVNPTPVPITVDTIPVANAIAEMVRGLTGAITANAESSGLMAEQNRDATLQALSSIAETMRGAMSAFAEGLRQLSATVTALQDSSEHQAEMISQLVQGVTDNPPSIELSPTFRLPKQRISLEGLTSLNRLPRPRRVLRITHSDDGASSFVEEHYADEVA